MSNSREDRNVNLGVINVPVRTKTTPATTRQPMSQNRSRLQQPHHGYNSSHRRSSNVSHGRSVPGSEEREGPPSSGHRKHHQPQHKQQQSLYELECDYDTNPTSLYELLETSAWEKARLRCRTHPEEVRTWIVRKDKNNMTRWKLLPLHAAIIFQSPSFVVSTLLERYPAAAMRKDDQGMLPLHLAFRHKQDDEDLLELLLLEHPRAVHQRDRRDRIPLEHGRESRFTAKLMRLYADAAVSTSQHAGNSSKLDHQTHATPTTAPSSPMAATSVSLTHLHQVEMEHEAKLAKVRADYDYEIEQLKSRHQDEMASLKEDMSLAVADVEQNAQRERRNMQEQHKEEYEQLKQERDEQAAQHQVMLDDLQTEVLQLQVAVEEAKHQEESMAEKYGKLVTVNVQMNDFLQDLAEEQVAMQDMALKQQDDLEAARMIRTELVQTLLHQEDSDGANERLKGTQMIEIGDRVQRKIKEFVSANAIQNDFGDDHHQQPHKVERKGPSRIEVEREDRIYSTQEGATEVQAATPIFANSNEPEESIVRKEEGDVVGNDSYYDDDGDLEMLADEVSAITDNSGY